MNQALEELVTVDWENMTEERGWEVILDVLSVLQEGL